jgi:hypothetical protein
VVVGHHTYLSNGQHGNAGSYDGFPFPPYNGKHLKRLIERELCQRMDLYIGGHDHLLQTIPGPKQCPKPLFVVSGTGASAAEIVGENPVYFQKAVLGFTKLMFTENELHVVQMNDKGELEHEQVIHKP